METQAWTLASLNLRLSPFTPALLRNVGVQREGDFFALMNDTDSAEFPFPGMKVVPYGWPMMADAWAACLIFSSGESDIMDRFVAETGIKLNVLVNRSPIQKMVDDATGFEREQLAAFADWVTINMWGVDGDEEEGVEA